MSALYDSSDLYESSSYTYEGYPLRTATGSGLSFSSVVAVRIVPKTATGSGGATAGDSATGLRKVFRTSSGGGEGNSTADVLRTVPRSASGAGAGTSLSYGASSILRAASGAGVGSSSIVSFAELYRDAATSSGQGSLDLALWNNAGEYMDRIIRMRPVQGPGFRRKVNYSVKR